MAMRLADADECRAGDRSGIVDRERRRFDMQGDHVHAVAQSRIALSRWIADAQSQPERMTVSNSEHRGVGIALRPMHGILRGPCDVPRPHVPKGVIVEYGTASGTMTRTETLITGRPIVDPVIERLGRAMVCAEQMSGVVGQSYAHGINLAISARHFDIHTDGYFAGRARVSGLSKWRMKRATDYMDANLAEPISLADIAAAAGLSRMHFAAQFRVASGLRPHEYLLRRRIERAQKLLLTSRMPLVEVAFEVGFKTQAHFTTTFRRLVGETPNVWRRGNQRSSGVAASAATGGAASPAA
jgi:AraC family transcriptional regulator